MEKKYTLVKTSASACIGRHRHSFFIIRDKAKRTAIEKEYRKLKKNCAPLWECGHCKKIIQSM